MKNCPSFEALSRFLDGELDEASVRQVADHLSGCDECAGKLAEASALDALIPLHLSSQAASPCPIRPSAGRDDAHLAECADCRRRWASTRRFRPLRVAAWAAVVLVVISIGFALTRPAELLMSPREIEAQLSRRSQPVPGRVAVAVGEVGIDPTGSAQARRAVSNDSLQTGDRVTTGEGQRVKLTLQNGAELLVNENTRLKLAPLGVQLEEGELVAVAPKPLEIETPSGTAALASGEVHVVTKSDQTSVSLVSGGGFFRGADPVIALAPDQELRCKGKAVSKVRREDRRLEWAEPMRNVYTIDQFETQEISPFWRLSDAVSRTQVDGRPALSLLPDRRARKRGAFVGTSGDFPVDEGVAFDLEFRTPRLSRGGRLVATVQSKEGGIVWAMSPEEETLEAHGEAKGRRGRQLLSNRSASGNSGWQRVKLVVMPRDVALYREGVLIERKPHGLTDLGRVRFAAGTQGVDKSWEPTECQIRRISVQRETLQ